jgi:hypothetical protein
MPSSNSTNSKLRPLVRTKTDIKGASTTFQKTGKGSAVQKTRHGIIQPMNIDHSNVLVTLEDWYAGDYIDKLDELKINHDERGVVTDNGAYALGRKTDELIINQLSATTSFVGDYSTGLTKALLSLAIETLNTNDVPDDGMRVGLLAPHAWEEFLNLDIVSSSDFVGESYPHLKGSEARMWRNVLWMPHTGLPVASTDDRDCYLFHKTAVAHASGADITSDFDWEGNRAAWFVNNMMSQGAGLIDSLGCVEIRVDDNTALT